MVELDVTLCQIAGGVLQFIEYTFDNYVAVFRDDLDDSDTTQRKYVYTYDIHNTRSTNEYALDSGATAHIWFNRDGLFGIKNCSCVKFEGLNGILDVTQYGFHGDKGRVYISDKGQLNIISFSALHGVCARELHDKENYYLIRGTHNEYAFYHVNGLYIYINTNTMLFSTVTGNRANYSPRDLKKVDYVNEMIRRSGFSYNNGLLSGINNSTWLNNPMTTLDIKNFKNCQGDNINRLQGKTVQKSSPVVPTSSIPRTPFIVFITLVADLFFVEKDAYSLLM